MILGKPEIIKRVKNAKPGDPSVYVNLDAIEQLPDEYESTIVEIEFNIENDFINVGTKDKPSLYPVVYFMNRIADKRGIEGYGKSISQPIYEDVNISIMEISPEPRTMKMKVGYSVIKQGAVMQEDGKMRPCSPRTGMYNAWEECVKLWTKEEMYTEGYTKQSTYPPKYNTSYKRRYHFTQELDKALGIADSTAWSKCIRELTGMQTGYTPEDLKEGKFYFAKIRRSKMAIKMETAAHLSAISKGANKNPDQVKLFGPTEDSQDVVKPEDDFPTKQVEPVRENLKSKREQLFDVMGFYIENKLIPTTLDDCVRKAMKWLETTEDAESNDKFWNRAIEILKSVENTINDAGRIEHSIYEK